MPVRKSVTVIAAINDCGFNLMEHQPYSPDLAPSDFRLLPKLKAAISGTQFHSDDDVILAVEGFLTSQDNEFFKSLRLGNVPFASLIATLVVFVGVGVFCGTLYRALQIIIMKVMDNLFGFSVQWLEVIQVVFIVIAVVMALFSIVLCVFGFLATGATRKNVYSGKKCIMGGSISAAFFMVISFILDLAWVVISCVATIPIIIYMMIMSICNEEVYNNSASKYCFELKHFGIYRNSTYANLGVSPPGKDQVCDTERRVFCDRVAEAGPMFAVALAGAVVIIIGMTMFLIILATNYTRIKISKEVTQYRNAIDSEELELDYGGKDPFANSR
ncbi:hypothetical protein FSP39_000735 [Pinctada imbricata]|uniref:Neuronal membrane glycoprotein M6-b n=1 Tax=Pinctada imbricata TaxID=66713 RepID=A0AA88Y683_PINIB|nr:hypothetical protein FSP39_000735 [Pinctada imbricata]